jgi:hypothetical protein
MCELSELAVDLRALEWRALDMRIRIYNHKRACECTRRSGFAMALTCARVVFTPCEQPSKRASNAQTFALTFTQACVHSASNRASSASASISSGSRALDVRRACARFAGARQARTGHSHTKSQTRVCTCRSPVRLALSR